MANRLTDWSRRCRGRLEAEIVLAFVAGGAAFVLAALISAAARSHVPGELLGAFFILVVVVIAHFGGVLYALPVGSSASRPSTGTFSRRSASSTLRRGSSSVSFS
jgi:hypothetical protein